LKVSLALPQDVSQQTGISNRELKGNVCRTTLGTGCTHTGISNRELKVQVLLTELQEMDSGASQIEN